VVTRASELWEHEKYLNGGCKEDRVRIFSVVPSDETGGSWHKLEHKRLPLKKSENFVTVRMTSSGTSCLEMWWSLHAWR